MNQSSSTACHQAMARLLCIPPTSIVLWGLVEDVDSLLGVLAANGLGDPSLWEEGPGGARVLTSPQTHMRTAQEDLYMDLLAVRNRGGNRFGLALVERSRGQGTLTLACSGWTQDATLTHDKLAFQTLPGPASIVERFGSEPLALATSAHAVLAHRRAWP